MKHSIYTSYDELPLMLSVTEVAAVLGISRAPVPMSWCMATDSRAQNRQSDRRSKG